MRRVLLLLVIGVAAACTPSSSAPDLVHVQSTRAVPPQLYATRLAAAEAVLALALDPDELLADVDFGQQDVVLVSMSPPCETNEVIKVSVASVREEHDVLTVDLATSATPFHPSGVVSAAVCPYPSPSDVYAIPIVEVSTAPNSTRVSIDGRAVPG